MGLSASAIAAAAAATAIDPEPQARRGTNRDRASKRARPHPNSPEFDIDRLKLTCDDGIFLVFEAPYHANQGVVASDRISNARPVQRPSGPAGYLAYWNHGRAGDVYVFGRMIYDAADVGDALRALKNEFKVDLAALAANSDRATTALELAGRRSAPAAASWLPSSREQVMYITGLWSPDDFELEDDDPAPGGSIVVASDQDHLPAPCGICVRPLGGSELPGDPYLAAMVGACDCSCGGDEETPPECSDDDLCTTSYLEGSGCSVKCIHRRKKCPCNVCAVNCRCISATGQCTNEPRNCDDGNECTYDRCITANGEGCQRIPLSDWTPCLDEGDPCTLDICLREGNTSKCRHPWKCPDQLCCNGLCCTNPCANDCCIQPDNSRTCCHGECMGSTCCRTIVCDGQCCPGSLNSCTEYPLCVNGQCVLGSPPCDDGDPCTEDRCTTTLCEAVCENVPDAATNGTSCDENDEDACTVGECENGTCQPVPGNHGAVCPDTDENACTVGECQGGVCTPIDDENGGACEDNDGNPCTVGSCFNGACVPGPGNHGATCEDGDGNDCTEGKCGGGDCLPVCEPACTACITSAGNPGWCDKCACVPESCSVALTSAVGEPCELVELTLSGTCSLDCFTMSYTLTAQYPPGYELVQPWLTISPPGKTVFCSGGPDVQTIEVYIHGDAPPGPVPILVTGTTLSGKTCQATGTVTVQRTYREVEIYYYTFIAPEAIESLDLAVWLWPYYGGDGRWFGFPGSSRSTQGAVISLDPSMANGQAGTIWGFFDPTSAYNDDPLGSDVVAWEFCSEDFANFDDWLVVKGATSNCSLRATPGVGGNVLSVQHQRVDSTSVQVHFDLVGYNPCATAVPAIDAHFVVSFRQICDGNILKPLEFKVSGEHDGFPWHELYVGGTRVYEHDPCCTHEDPNSLFPFPLGKQWNFQQESPNDACHVPLTVQPLQNWQSVP